MTLTSALLPREYAPYELVDRFLLLMAWVTLG